MDLIPREEAGVAVLQTGGPRDAAVVSMGAMIAKPYSRLVALKLDALRRSAEVRRPGSVTSVVSTADLDLACVAAGERGFRSS